MYKENKQHECYKLCRQLAAPFWICMFCIFLITNINQNIWVLDEKVMYTTVHNT